MCKQLQVRNLLNKVIFSSLWLENEGPWTEEKTSSGIHNANTKDPLPSEYRSHVDVLHTQGHSSHGGINEMERLRGMILIYSCGGDPLCALHRAEGLYG